MPRRSSPPPPSSPPPKGGVPCVILDPTSIRLHTGALGGSYDFSGRVPNWQAGGRIRIWLKMQGNNSLHDEDAQSALCEPWCDPDPKDIQGHSINSHEEQERLIQEHCGWCKCAGCDYCTRTSGLRLGQSCTVSAQISSCWGAKIIEHDFLGQATVRLGAPTSDKDFGCNVALPQVPYMRGSNQSSAHTYSFSPDSLSSSMGRASSIIRQGLSAWTT